MSSDFPSVTSLQCVDALRGLGFDIEDVRERIIRLVRADGRRVFIERHKTLSAEEIRVILLVAGVTREDFLESVARRGSRLTTDAVDGDSSVRSREGAFLDVPDLTKRRPA